MKVIKIFDHFGSHKFSFKLIFKFFYHIQKVVGISDNFGGRKFIFKFFRPPSKICQNFGPLSNQYNEKW